MSRVETRGTRKRHPFVTTLWVVAALTIAIGFLMRMLAPWIIGHELRLSGILCIAGGLALAAIGWLVERSIGMKPPPA